MPNRYLPTALVEMIKEQRDEYRGQLPESDQHIPEYEILVAMLQQEYRTEFENRHNDE